MKPTLTIPCDAASDDKLFLAMQDNGDVCVGTGASLASKRAEEANEEMAIRHTEFVVLTPETVRELFVWLGAYLHQ